MRAVVFIPPVAALLIAAGTPDAPSSLQDARRSLDLLAAASIDGLAPPPQQLAAWRRDLASDDLIARAVAAGEIEMASATLVEAEQGGRVMADRLPAAGAMRPTPLAFPQALDLVRRLGADRAVREVRSADARYAALAAAHERYRGIVDAGGWPRLASAPTDSDLLERRLQMEAPLPGASLKQEIASAQRRYSLPESGVLDGALLRELDVPADRRLAQIEANLERWRWAPRRLPADRVELNIAEAELTLFKGDAPTLRMRAIVGTRDRPTPILADTIRAVVLNPPWNVPADIAEHELWPKFRRDPDLMAREGFVVTPSRGLQQKPGKGCALGAIKFDLGNSFGVHLHDTSNPSLFRQDVRTLSHGCMRIEKPNALAKAVLAGAPDWPSERIDLVLLSGRTQRAPLSRPMPVYVFYWTAVAGEDGKVVFHPDVYGWDRDLLALLAAPRAEASVQR